MVEATEWGGSLPAVPAHDAITESVWMAWNADPQVLLPAALLAFWYARGLRARHLRSRDRWRAVWFSLGLAAIVLAIESPVDRLGEHHFTFHMVQHDLFILVGAPLMLLGAPATVLRGMPQSLRRRVVTPLARSKPVRALHRGLTYPPVSAGVLVAVLFAWHLLPSWFDAALRNDTVHEAQHLSLLAAGFIFWLPSIDSHPFRSRLGYGQRLVYQAPMIGARVAPGMILALSGEPLYDGYADVRPVVAGLTGMVDQEVRRRRDVDLRLHRPHHGRRSPLRRADEGLGPVRRSGYAAWRAVQRRAGAVTGALAGVCYWSGGGTCVMSSWRRLPTGMPM